MQYLSSFFYSICLNFILYTTFSLGARKGDYGYTNEHSPNVIKYSLDVHMYLKNVHCLC